MGTLLLVRARAAVVPFVNGRCLANFLRVIKIVSTKMKENRNQWSNQDFKPTSYQWWHRSLTMTTTVYEREIAVGARMIDNTSVELFLGSLVLL